MSNNALAAIVLVVGFAACVTDVRSRRIPNLLTFGAAAAGLLVHTILGGWSGLQLSLTGWVVGAALFFPFFALGGMGGGDVKLLAALGAWLGPRDAFWLAIYASIAGGAMALVLAVSRGYLRVAFRNVWSLVTFWFLVGPRSMPAMTLEHHKGPRLAYALPIFAGTVVTVWLG